MITSKAHLHSSNTSPSGEVVFLLFKVESIFDFLEGQFLMIQTERNGVSLKKPYSIATTNKKLQEENLIGFVVKKASEEGMSHFLTKEITLGDTIELKGPLGHYTDSKAHPNYLFISVGSGLSPNLGLFTHLVYESESFNKIISIYGEKTVSNLIPEVENSFREHGKENVSHKVSLSREKLRGYENGYVQELLPDAVEDLGTDTLCFICGLPSMVDEVRALLEDLGIDKNNITFEKY